MNNEVNKNTYLKKKDELVKLKTELMQKKSDFGQKGKLWVEPLKEWIESAANAEKLASSKDFSLQKSFLEKIGTNRLLRDKKIRIDFAPIRMK